MSSISPYLLRIVAAAIICSIATTIVGKKGTLATTVKLICGIFISVTLISPLVNIKIADMTNYIDDLKIDASDMITQAEEGTRTQIAERIKQQTQSYILDKAETYGAHLTVEVSVETSGLPVPNGVTIRGDVSPYAKSQLQQLIVDNFDISPEAQQWLN